MKWNFAGEKPHNVTVKSGPGEVQLEDDGERLVLQEDDQDRAPYTIYCTIHGQSDQSMKLKVTSK